MLYLDHMAGRDRRQHHRLSFAQKGTFRWCGRTLEGLLSDVSVTGGFMKADEAPPIGARLTFTFEPNDENQEQKRVEFQGEVTRSQPSDNAVPGGEPAGFAVRWIQARTYGSSRFLRQFLKSMFGLDMLVYKRKTGHVAWTPAPRGMVAETAAPPPVEGRRPDRSIAVVSTHMSRSEPRAPTHLEDRLTPPPLPPEALPEWAKRPVAPSAQAPIFEGTFTNLNEGDKTPAVMPASVRQAAARMQGNVIQLVPQVGMERRCAERKETDARVHFRLNATTLTGEVHEVSETGLWIVTEERRLPRVGDLLACRYPIAELGDHDVRLVGKVVRQGTDRRAGFAIELVRIDDRGVPGAFRAHIERLQSVAE